MATTYTYTSSASADDKYTINLDNDMYTVNDGTNDIFKISKGDIERLSDMINNGTLSIEAFTNSFIPEHTVSTTVFPVPGQVSGPVPGPVSGPVPGPVPGHGLEVLTQNSTIDEIIKALPELRINALKYYCDKYTANSPESGCKNIKKANLVHGYLKKVNALENDIESLHLAQIKLQSKLDEGNKLSTDQVNQLNQDQIKELYKQDFDDHNNKLNNILSKLREIFKHDDTESGKDIIELAIADIRTAFTNMNRGQTGKIFDDNIVLVNDNDKKVIVDEIQDLTLVLEKTIDMYNILTYEGEVDSVLNKNLEQIPQYVHRRLFPLLKVLYSSPIDENTKTVTTDPTLLSNSNFIAHYNEVKDTVDKIKTKIPSYNQLHDDYNSDIFNKMEQTARKDFETQLGTLLGEMQQLFETVNTHSGQPKSISNLGTAVSTLYKEKDFGTLNKFTNLLVKTDISLPDEIKRLVNALTLLINKLPVYFNKMLSTYGVLSRTFYRDISKIASSRTSSSLSRKLTPRFVTSRSFSLPAKLHLSGIYKGGNNKSKKMRKNSGKIKTRKVLL